MTYFHAAGAYCLDVYLSILLWLLCCIICKPFCVQVRDRATLYLNSLGDGSVAETDKDVKEFLFGSLDIPLTNMETTLRNYVCIILTGASLRVILHKLIAFEFELHLR